MNAHVADAIDRTSAIDSSRSSAPLQCAALRLIAFISGVASESGEAFPTRCSAPRGPISPCLLTFHSKRSHGVQTQPKSFDRLLLAKPKERKGSVAASSGQALTGCI
jgi:hypothetical protein